MFVNSIELERQLKERVTFETFSSEVIKGGKVSCFYPFYYNNRLYYSFGNYSGVFIVDVKDRSLVSHVSMKGHDVHVLLEFYSPEKDKTYLLAGTWMFVGMIDLESMRSKPVITYFTDKFEDYAYDLMTLSPADPEYFVSASKGTLNFWRSEESRKYKSISVSKGSYLFRLHKLSKYPKTFVVLGSGLRLFSYYIGTTKSMKKKKSDENEEESFIYCEKIDELTSLVGVGFSSKIMDGISVSSFVQKDVQYIVTSCRKMICILKFELEDVLSDEDKKMLEVMRRISCEERSSRNVFWRKDLYVLNNQILVYIKEKGDCQSVLSFWNFMDTEEGSSEELTHLPKVFDFEISRNDFYVDNEKDVKEEKTICDFPPKEYYSQTIDHGVFSMRILKRSEKDRKLFGSGNCDTEILCCSKGMGQKLIYISKISLKLGKSLMEILDLKERVEFLERNILGDENNKNDEFDRSQKKGIFDIFQLKIGGMIEKDDILVTRVFLLL